MCLGSCPLCLRLAFLRFCSADPTEFSLYSMEMSALLVVVVVEKQIFKCTVWRVLFLELQQRRLWWLGLDYRGADDRLGRSSWQASNHLDCVTCRECRVSHCSHTALALQQLSNLGCSTRLPAPSYLVIIKFRPLLPSLCSAHCHSVRSAAALASSSSSSTLPDDRVEKKKE